MGKALNLLGKKFGRLTVVRLHKSNGYPGHSRLMWWCLCDCGTERSVSGYDLGRRTFSCGCFHAERAAEVSTTHGHTKGGKRTPEYKIWSSMMYRCSPAAKGSNRIYYWTKGIRVCRRWKSFENFYEDMGPCPKDKTLERLDSEKGYFPENCDWATWEQQANNTCKNKRMTWNGLTMTIAQWARKLKIPYMILWRGLSKENKPEKILEEFNLRVRR